MKIVKIFNNCEEVKTPNRTYFFYKTNRKHLNTNHMLCDYFNINKESCQFVGRDTTTEHATLKCIHPTKGDITLIVGTEEQINSIKKAVIK